MLFLHETVIYAILFLLCFRAYLLVIYCVICVFESDRRWCCRLKSLIVYCCKQKLRTNTKKREY